MVVSKVSWTEQDIDEAIDEVWAYLRAEAPYSELAQATTDSEIFDSMREGLKASLDLINQRDPDTEEMAMWLRVLFDTSIRVHESVSERWANIAKSSLMEISEPIRKALEDRPPDDSAQ